MVDFSLTDEQKKLIEEVRAMGPELEKKSLEIDAAGDDHFDYSLVSQLAEQNLLTPIVPVRFGGRGFDYFTNALFFEEIGAICTGLAAVLGFNSHVGSIISMVGNEEQKETYLPLLTEKTPRLAAVALSESGAGSDVGSMTTTATFEDGRYLINGTKDYMINGAIADLSVCFAVLDPTRGRSTMVTFIIPGQAEGLEVGTLRNKMGIRHALTHEMIFRGVQVDPKNIIGDVGNGYMVVTQAIDRDKVMVGAASVGLARSAYNKALAFAKERRQFGRSILDNQAIAFEFAQMLAEIEAARMLVWKACWLIDRNADFTLASSFAKIAGTSVAQSVVSRAADIVGGRAFLKGHPLEKLYRDAKILPTAEGTNHIQKAIIASLL